MTDHTRKPLRWVPAAILASIILLALIAPMILPPFDLSISMLAGVISAVLILLWWMFLSRARWVERIAVAAAIALAVVATSMFVDPSIAGGAQGMLGYILGVEFFALAL